MVSTETISSVSGLLRWFIFRGFSLSFMPHRKPQGRTASRPLQWELAAYQDQKPDSAMLANALGVQVFSTRPVADVQSIVHSARAGSLPPAEKTKGKSYRRGARHSTRDCSTRYPYNQIQKGFSVPGDGDIQNGGPGIARTAGIPYSPRLLDAGFWFSSGWGRDRRPKRVRIA